VQVRGHYDVAHQFLIDNQMQDGKPGYYVLTPFLIDSTNRAVLVNRGWLPLGAERSHLPDVEINTDVSEINGRINQFPAVGIKLKGAEIPTNGWPAVVQVVDSEVLAEKLAYGLYDFQIELDADANAGYKRQWKISTIISPEKHLAYAVQWFGLALALTGLFIWISSRKLK
jgi:surfeit locus 1 family protein